MNVAEAEVLARLTAILEKVAYRKRPCKLCGEFCYWIQAQDGTQYCLDAQGLNHRQTCKRAPLAPPVRGAKARQDPLFGPDPASFL